VQALPEGTLVKAKPAKKKRVRKAKQVEQKTVDPKFVAWSPELRDRSLEEAEVEPSLIAASEAKHDVRRQIAKRGEPMRLLPPVANEPKRLAA
jgi:hypothetical protein